MTTVIEQIKTGVEAHLNGNLKAAESAYRTAISLDEQNATAYNNLGFVCAQLKRWGEAFECLNTALQLKPDYSMAHTNLGQVLLNMGQEQSGLEHLETAVQCDANNAQAWENLGQIKLRTGDPARAEYCWWRASQLQPENLQLYVQLATAIAAQQRYNESNRILSSVLNNDENCVNAWVQLGINHFLQTNLGASQQALQEALQHDVRNYRALKHLSLVAIASGKTVQAETLLQTLAGYYPNDIETQVDLGVVELSLHKVEQAKDRFENVLTQKANCSKAGYYLAVAYQQMGEDGKAGEVLKELADIVTGGDRYYRKIQELAGLMGEHH